MSDFDNDQPPAPSPPRFIRRALSAVGLAETTTPSLREAEEQARVAKAREAEAREAASIATAERQRAERQLGPARQQAKHAADVLSQGVTARLRGLETQLARVKQREQADTVMPSPGMRLRARGFLHAAPGEEGGGTALMSLVTLDAIAGMWYEASRVGDQLRAYVYDEGGSDELANAADQLECEGWHGCMNRIKFLAGESS